MTILQNDEDHRRVIVGLAGRKRVGKDSIADILMHEYGFGSDSFATPIRDFVYGLTEGPDRVESGDRKEDLISWLGCSRRELMQTLGTEWGRKMIHPDIWINALRHRIAKYPASHTCPLVITDIRFEDEAQAVRDMGGWVVHVRRPGLPQTDTHESEADLQIQKVDGLIYNDGDLTALESTVRNAVIPAIEKLFGAQS